MVTKMHEIGKLYIDDMLEKTCSRNSQRQMTNSILQQREMDTRLR